MPDLPAGTVTFLFMDIEGSTRLIQSLGDDRYADLLAQHRRLVREVFAAHGGVEVDSSGDAFFVAFPSATGAARAAVDIQRVITGHAWPADTTPQVRIGLHTGEPIVTPAGYVGLDVHRAARVCSVGHGGQILLSETTHGLLRLDQLPGALLVDLGAHRLKDLQRPEPLFQLGVPGLPSAFPPLRSLSIAPNNLPVQLTTFIGRQREMAEIKAALEQTPLVTLTGPAGSGKTRLAIQVAADLIDVFPDGVWLVELEALTDPAQVVPAAVTALQIPQAPERPPEKMLEDALRPKRALIVLDNCEHLVDACARLAVALTRTCPNLRILATSRQALRAMGEATYPVVSLPLPPLSPLPPLPELARNDAVALFVARARLSKHDFVLAQDTAAAVARVVHRLEGIPLAIELAAARTRVLAVADIAARLDDRFQLLVGGGPTAGRRRQTLRGALDWSYDLLTAEERIFFHRLSVFAGACTLEAAETVCADDRIPRGRVLDLVEDLVDRSLLLPDHAGQLQGFRMLETIREYGREKLEGSGEASEVRRRHLEYFLWVAEAAAKGLRGDQQREWLERLSADHDNFRAALRWCLDAGRGKQGLRLAGSLWWFWYARGHWDEGSQWLEAFLARDERVAGPAPIEALAGAAYLAWRHGDYTRAETYAAQCLSLSREFDDPRGRAYSLLTLGLVARRRDEFTRAAAHHEESLSLFRDLRDEWGTAWSLRLLAIALNYLGEYGRAVALFEDSCRIFRQMGNTHGLAYSIHGLARVHVHAGDCARALALLEEAETLLRSLDDLEGLASVQHTRGLAAMCRGDYDQARTLLEESLIHFKASGDAWSATDVLNPLASVQLALGDREGAADRLVQSLLERQQRGTGWDRLGIAESLETLAAVEAAGNRADTAARWLGAADTLRETMRAPVPPYRQGEHDALTTRVQRTLSAPAFRAAFDAGRALTLDQIFRELRSGRPG